MTNSIQRDKKKRLLFSKYELKRLELTSIIHDLNFSKDIRYKNLQELNKLPRNSSKIRIKNRCILTGRGHSVLRFCGFSRLKFRELASQGRLVGVTKASW
uniref:Small ribosomal subunit protein uS14m n=2 Tax=Chlorella TaxID=3071 RepID=A0A097P5W4_CHLVA|nr:30S ribosomal protein S14 [Chlorella variabilis]AIU38965.1 30S ribosomal protein S14 [Chlorella variabilis]AJP09424.1 30S ribosomal protein S14 [Chlorella variabilis]AST08883.1 30S ribosomal protein S14 [Chlorella sp. ATCC 30562]